MFDTHGEDENTSKGEISGTDMVWPFTCSDQATSASSCYADKCAGASLIKCLQWFTPTCYVRGVATRTRTLNVTTISNGRHVYVCAWSGHRNDITRFPPKLKYGYLLELRGLYFACSSRLCSLIYGKTYFSGLSSIILLTDCLYEKQCSQAR